MRQLFLSFALIVGAAPGLAGAADGPKTSPTAQQSKMTTCQRDAGEKKLEGKERQAFVTDCLRAQPPAPAASATQGQKLGACSKEAASQGLKGDERKQFLSDCGKR